MIDVMPFQVFVPQNSTSLLCPISQCPDFINIKAELLSHSASVMPSHASNLGYFIFKNHQCCVFSLVEHYVSEAKLCICLCMWTGKCFFCVTFRVLVGASFTAPQILVLCHSLGRYNGDLFGVKAEMNKGLQCDACHVSLMSHDHAARPREVEVMVDWRVTHRPLV